MGSAEPQDKFKFLLLLSKGFECFSVSPALGVPVSS